MATILIGGASGKAEDLETIITDLLTAKSVTDHEKLIHLAVVQNGLNYVTVTIIYIA